MSEAEKRSPVKVRVSIEIDGKMVSDEREAVLSNLTRFGRALALAGVAKAAAEAVISALIKGGQLDE